MAIVIDRSDKVCFHDVQREAAQAYRIIHELLSEPPSDPRIQFTTGSLAKVSAQFAAPAPSKPSNTTLRAESSTEPSSPWSCSPTDLDIGTSGSGEESTLGDRLSVLDNSSQFGTLCAPRAPSTPGERFGVRVRRELDSQRREPRPGDVDAERES